MHYNKSKFVLLFLFSTAFVAAQKPVKSTSVALYNQIEKANFLGSVLYIAAHPDDENTRLISYLSNDVKARTGYLSLTRGDGGQNLIGPQLRELLGVIRTQELIEARKIDGGEQFFSRANDFGFSKNPEETLTIWNENEVLADVIWTIRKFQPDVIINRFDHRTGGTTHGHHTSSAILSTKSFAMTNDPTLFPEQLQYVTPWQTKRQFFNTSWWFYGSQEKFDAANKATLSTLKTGTYYKNLGKSNQEIAALSRSSHQSQGFGSTGSRGVDTEYLELVNGTPLQNKDNLFEGIDTSWNRVKGGKPIGELLAKILANYNFQDPSASVKELVTAYSMIQKLEETHWKTIKSTELEQIIAGCTGLYLEAAAATQEVFPDSTVKLKLEAINRSEVPMMLKSITTQPENKSTTINTALAFNDDQTFPAQIVLPATTEYTQPYWLKEPSTVGMYTVSDQKNRGIPDIIRDAQVTFNIEVAGTVIPFTQKVVYKYNDDVRGEIFDYLDVVPEVTSSIINKVALFTANESKAIAVKVKAGKDNINGIVALDLPKEWKVTPANYTFSLDKKGMDKTVVFNVTAPAKPSEVAAKSIVTVGDKQYTKDQIIIDYKHITKQQVLEDAAARFIQVDLKTTNKKIAYIMGAGDQVPESLIQMGYQVTVIDPIAISTNSLKAFDVVITGIRAYNTVPLLANKQQILLDFVKSGKTMIVQYNTPSNEIPDNIAPYSLHISRDRVTDENAATTFLAPKHSVLNYPNQITTEDFEGWTQEQGLYYPDQYDAHFTPILSSADKGESPKDGALLVAPYGKGFYVYTGLSFFRELPVGVSGAYRLLSNIISLQSTPTTDKTTTKN
ncbi:PIG-L family deacetylase [Flavobacterium sp. 14A]|uniref:PIG-L family deacetylase n=1 Tax=Flavobacterium sp. 14A TaxID=2735896 RepID=UPI00156FF855|nr:PIG-L family deacetylase [Flavobacterium sp. 14A]NRT12683.1 LmbE family N-acetylglucosaminyl deacetylase [Flavobacterium sp. 14A]